MANSSSLSWPSASAKAGARSKASRPQMQESTRFIANISFCEVEPRRHAFHKISISIQRGDHDPKCRHPAPCLQLDWRYEVDAAAASRRFRTTIGDRRGASARKKGEKAE